MNKRISVVKIRAFFKGLKKIWKRAAVLGGILAGVALLGGGILFYKAGEIYDFEDTSDGVHLPPVDAIVCLSGGKGRISAAADIWYRYRMNRLKPVPSLSGLSPQGAADRPPVLYISGMGQRSSWRSFRRSLRRGVREVIQPSQVVLETESSNTEANAKFLLRYAEQHGWERILLMTSVYHMKRSAFIFDRVLASAQKPIRVETLSIVQEQFERAEWKSSWQGIRMTLWEYIKWIYYRNAWSSFRGART